MSLERSRKQTDADNSTPSPLQNFKMLKYLNNFETALRAPFRLSGSPERAVCAEDSLLPPSSYAHLILCLPGTSATTTTCSAAPAASQRLRSPARPTGRGPRSRSSARVSAKSQNMVLVVDDIKVFLPAAKPSGLKTVRVVVVVVVVGGAVC